MPKIYFTSGKVEDLEVSEADFERMVLKMQTSGIKMIRLKNGSLVPLNSNTIEIITRDFPEQLPSVVVAPIASTEAVCVVKEEPVGNIQTEDKTIESAVQKEKKALDIIIEKSNCRHEVEKLILSKVDGKKGSRYFYVCSFCGWRGRYVKGETLSNVQKEEAKIYADK